MGYLKVSKDMSGQLQDLWNALSRLGKDSEWTKHRESLVLSGDRASQSETTAEMLTHVGPSTLTVLVQGRRSKSSLPMLSATLVGAPAERVSQQHHA